MTDRHFLSDDFDISNFPENHPCFLAGRRKWLFSWKNEYAEHRVNKWSRVACKASAEIVEGMGEKTTMRGVSMDIQKHVLKFQVYENALIERSQGGDGIGPEIKMNIITTLHHIHQLITARGYKQSFVVCDPKRDYQKTNNWKIEDGPFLIYVLDIKIAGRLFK